MNDPNGLIHHGGLYHLFFQYNPEGNEHANMSWGHATSSDLLTWAEHPVAVPFDDFEEVFSGSVVLDEGNTSGFGAEGRPPLVALYTSARSDGQAQALAWSTDGGMTWAKHRIVLDRGSTDFRDPKVIRYRDHWLLMAVEAVDRQIRFYRSENLIEWEPLSTFGPYGAPDGIWECPDMFRVGERWVLTLSVNPGHPAGGSGMQYFIGDFDGTTFTPESWEWLDRGTDYYAGITFGGLDEPIMIAWLNNWSYAHHVPTAPWRGSMALPRRIDIRDGRLIQEPAVQLSRDPHHRMSRTPLGPEPLHLPESAIGTASRIRLLLRPEDDTVSIALRDTATGAVTLRIACRAEELRIMRAESSDAFHPAFTSTAIAALPLPHDGVVDLDIWIDANSLEVFAQDGAITMSLLTLADPAQHVVEITSTSGTAVLEHLSVTDPTPDPIAGDGSGT